MKKGLVTVGAGLAFAAGTFGSIEGTSYMHERSAKKHNAAVATCAPYAGKATLSKQAIFDCRGLDLDLLLYSPGPEYFKSANTEEVIPITGKNMAESGFYATMAGLLVASSLAITLLVGDFQDRRIQRRESRMA